MQSKQVQAVSNMLNFCTDFEDFKLIQTPYVRFQVASKNYNDF